MKTYQLIHVCKELGARSIIVTQKELLLDTTIPYEEYEAALESKVGGKMLLHYGSHPVKTGTLIRKDDVIE
jgi:hypothetical protein